MPSSIAVALCSDKFSGFLIHALDYRLTPQNNKVQVIPVISCDSFGYVSFFFTCKQLLLNSCEFQSQNNSFRDYKVSTLLTKTFHHDSGQ